MFMQKITSGVMQMITEDDNNSVICYVRVLSILVGVALTGCMIYQAVVDIAHFSLDAAGRTMLEYLSGVGGAIWAKTKSGA